MSSQSPDIRTFLDVEEQIIICLNNQDRHALTLIYKSYSAAMFNIIKRIVKHDEIAQDVLQDALVKIWKNGRSFNRSKGSLYTWLAQICRNAAIDKTRSKDFQLTEKSKDSVDLVSINNQPDLDQRVDELYLRQMIDRLPENQRTLIDLSFFQGYTHKEIAQNLELPLGTVKTRIRLAIKQLRAII